MRILRVPSDFRVVEQFDDSMLTRKGEHLVYSVLKKGMTTGEAAERLAQAAGVEIADVVAAGQKPREGVSGQIFSIRDGEPLALRSPEFSARRLGVSNRHVEPSDLTGNAYEIVVRDLRGDDMRRLRHNLAQLRNTGMPNYFDDQRFGCLRHGQGYIMRDVLRGRYEQALRAAIAAPSPYGNEQVERYKAQIREHWGDWKRLISISNGRRGKSAFEHLAENEGDFLGALRVGLASRERTMHLFAYQSHLYNRALSARVRALIEDEEALAWLPCDEGSLPVWRELPTSAFLTLERESLPLPGPGMEELPEAMRWYAPVFESEGITFEDFCAVDLPGFRPAMEERPTVIQPEFLRAAPAQEDELYSRSRKMRVRFTLPRGHYATLVLKRLLMPTEAGAGRLCIWVSRHPLVWPKDDGTPQAFERREREFEPRHQGDRGGRGGFRRDDRRPFRRDDRDGVRRDYRRDDRDGGRRDYRRDDRDGGRRDFRRDDRDGGRRDYRRDDRDGERRDSRRDDRSGRRREYSRDDRDGGRREYRRDDRNEERRDFRRDDRDGGRRDDRHEGRREYRRADRNEGRREYRRDDRRGDRRDEGRDSRREDRRYDRRDERRPAPREPRGDSPYRGRPSEPSKKPRPDGSNRTWQGNRSPWGDAARDESTRDEE